jgi:uncharacterized protein YodC (DUF2158 family)
MKREEIKIGDVVYLNSGSPRLTVENINDEFQTVAGKLMVETQIRVTWVGHDNCIQAANFPSECLTTTRPPYEL